MIEVYSWPAPIGHKVHVMQEETGLAYRATAVDIGAAEQLTPRLLAIVPTTRSLRSSTSMAPTASRSACSSPV